MLIQKIIYVLKKLYKIFPYKKNNAGLNNSELKCIEDTGVVWNNVIARIFLCSYNIAATVKRMYKK